jgi:DNA-binding winged helix-turn-helix (wHTH) protein
MIVLNVKKCVLIEGNNAIRLAPARVKILQVLAQSAPSVVACSRLRARACAPETVLDGIRVQMCSLRRELREGGIGLEIYTAHRNGYFIESGVLEVEGDDTRTVTISESLSASIMRLLSEHPDERESNRVMTSLLEAGA